MGINVSSKKLPATSKLCSWIATYLFEEEYGEIEKLSSASIKALKETQKLLSSQL